MKFCNKCGNELKEGEKVCNRCGKKIEFEDLPKDIPINNIKNKVYPNKRKSNSNIENKDYNKRITVILTIVGLLLVGLLFINKKALIAKYYIVKGNLSTDINDEISQYGYAIEAKYDDKTLDMIYNKLKNSDNYENEILKFKEYVPKNKLEELYRNIYTYKAEKAYDNRQYKISQKLLEKACYYGYDEKKFIYYKNIKKDT